jgi:predicted Zn-dependent protease
VTFSLIFHTFALTNEFNQMMKPALMNKICFYLFIFLFIPATLYVGCKKDKVKDSEKKVELPGNKLGIGSSANHLLSDKQFTKLVVDLMYMENHAPSSSSIDKLKSFLNKYINKPEGIIFNQRMIQSGNKSAYSAEDVRMIEDKHRKEFNSEGILTLSILFLDADYAGNSGNSKVLGIAYRNTSMAIFQKTVKDYSGGITQPARSSLETTILNHEAGHLLGLVDIGSEMVVDHQDAAHGHHCNNNKCLMYYTVESTDFVSELIGNPVPDLDENCRKDLKVNGGK